jgi:creatinine amidohydrolase
MARDGEVRSLELLRERIASIPAELQSALEDDAPLRAQERFGRPQRLTIAGAGGSMGPALILGACLEETGWNVRVDPPSAFVLRRTEGALCVVSQGISPNARLALRRGGSPKLLITASSTDEQAVVIRHGPASESGMLVRVVGPALATLAAIRFSGVVEERALASLPARVAEAECSVPDVDFERVVIIAAGDYTELVQGLRWKLIETLGYGDPPVYGVLQFAHGPFQQVFDERILCLVLDRGIPEEQALFDRLGHILVPERHHLLRLRASLPSPLCWFEHDAMVNALVLQMLERQPRDLIDWPGKSRDRALYELDE